jgi:hypothetical protein
MEVMSRQASNELVRCLEEFARGTRTRVELEECLSGTAELRFWDTNERSSVLGAPLPRVLFGRADIDRQLQRFLAGALNARDLSDWAAGMRLLGCFTLTEDDPISSSTWDLMDEIMSPDVWEPLTVDTVIELRRRLSQSP